MARCYVKTNNWQEAAAAFSEALQHPAFDWGFAGKELPTTEQWMAVAFVRAGE